ncbi:MAG: competence/damage-inducible protein A [Actinomycetota bacterium]
MRAEVVGVGTELLLGQITNTNAGHISAALATIGVDVYFHTNVGDNLARIEATLLTAAERADAVVITGGLGPTSDDITAAAVASATGRRLVRDERLAAFIRGFFEGRGRAMPESNLKQADLPEGAVPIEPEGTAPGFYLEHSGTVIFCLPGVPWEMEAMLDKTVLPVLRKRSGDGITISRHVLTVGLGESALAQAIADLVDAQSNPTIAFLAGGGTARVRLTAKAPSAGAAEALIQPVEAAIRRRLGDAALEPGEDTVVGVFSSLARGRNLTVATAESLTGGLLGANLTEAEGASDFYAGSLVCYSTDAKREVAGVDPRILEEYGAVSAPCAAALAEAAAKHFGADVGVSTTGVAGPAEQEGKKPGTILVGAYVEGRAEARFVQGYGNRANVRAIAVNSALDLARRMILATAGS